MHNKDNSEYKNNPDGMCCLVGCNLEGKFPAPKSPEERNERYYFCLQHIRQYNNSWDYFSKMDANAIDSFQKDNIIGHRPTWKFGVKSVDINNLEALRNQVFGIFRGTHINPSQNNNAHVNLPPAVLNAMKILGISYPVTMQEIKKKYKELAKEHHPDVNNHSSDIKIKRINQAYNLLKNSDL